MIKVKISVLNEAEKGVSKALGSDTAANGQQIYVCPEAVNNQQAGSV